MTYNLETGVYRRLLNAAQSHTIMPRLRVFKKKERKERETDPLSIQVK